jgi:hypothetical protein
MTTPDSQERLKEEAKALRVRIGEIIRDEDAQVRAVRTLAVYAGMITETLIEYEEPDVVMEQAFHRIADLLKTDPTEQVPSGALPPAWALDHDTELGRHLARGAARRLPKGLDDIHEIAIALIISDLPSFAGESFPQDAYLRLLIEMVIVSLTFEMATQDFCDLLIEDYIADGNSAADALVGLSAVAGELFAASGKLAPETERDFTNVMVRESLRHGTPGSKNWTNLAPANDSQNTSLPEFMKTMKPEIEEFFALIGLEDTLSRAVSVAKAVGRMVAVITVEDVGQIHPSIAKSLAKTGMILGSKYKAAN